MVDATGENAFNRRANFYPCTYKADAGRRVSVTGADDASLKRLGALCTAWEPSPSQSRAWVENWVRHANPDVIIATLEEDRKPVLVLALEIVSEKGCRVARFPGGSHANSNFPAVDAEFARQADASRLRELVAGIKRERPDIDLIRLDRQIFEREGVGNPLALLGAAESPNIALWADLTGGFDALADKGSMKRKHKRHRAHARKFEELGKIGIFRARAREDVERCLDFFFEQKAERFRKAGIKNVFESPQIQSFMRDLFTKSGSGGDDRHILTAMEVGNRLLAVSAETTTLKRVTCEFAAFDASKDIQGSPGEYLYFENISRACDEGFEIYDFGVGDEDYKRQWCKIEIVQFDTVLPLTSKGRIYAASNYCVSLLKRMAKRNERIWRLVKLVRRKLAG